MTVKLFDTLIPTSSDIFFHKNDPHDTKLGETVAYQSAEYLASDIVILGLPQDEGVRRNGGRVGASQAPEAIRRALYKYVTIPQLKLCDVGNTPIQSSLEETHTLHQAIVQKILDDGKKIVILGGGNDTSYPDCAALSQHVHKQLIAINIDAHFDVRADEPRNSGTPYRQLLEEGYISPQRFYEIAYQPFANSPTYINYLDQKGVIYRDLRHVHQYGLESILNECLQPQTQAIFWGLDMDVIRAADAPGVSAINPSGLTGEEFAHIGIISGHETRTRILEITEMNPNYDIDNRTARLAAQTIWNFLYATIN